MVDQTSKQSLNSTYAYYTVGIPCKYCGESTVDNQFSQDAMPYQFSNEYKVTNFPNPFNPVTKINYNIPVESNVSITVYSSVGQLIKTILNENKSLDTHILEFDGSGLPSGVYFYKFEAIRFSIIQKMLLIK